MLKSAVFVVDNVHRDLPSLALVGYFLRKHGITVRFFGTTEIVLKWWMLRNCLVIFNKPFSFGFDLSFLKNNGCVTAVINTEGAMGSRFTHESSQMLDFIFFGMKRT